ncbi:MAG: DUF4065 domain-containing protein [Bacteroidia bacterium]
MKSPFTGKEMTLLKEQREIVFRKEAFEVTFHFWKCADTEQQFTDERLDELNLEQAHAQYRVRHRLPFKEEIAQIREQYGISAAKMSEILGFGVNVYRQYEAGEVPNESNARLIQLASVPEDFRRLVQLCDGIDEKYRTKLLMHIDQMRAHSLEQAKQQSLEEYLVGSRNPDEYSGYRRPSLSKVGALVAAFAKAMQPWKTQLNKLLFYADFIHFSKTCQSITGLRYIAIKMGPVPKNFDGIFQYLVNQDVCSIDYVEYDDSIVGERFLPASSDLAANLTDEELDTVKEVVRRFEGMSTRDIVFLSHLERAWVETIDQENRGISYQQYAFNLQRYQVL